MAIFQKPDQIISRSLSLGREKNMEGGRPKGGRKWIFILFFGTVILSLGLWFYGNFRKEEDTQKLVIPEPAVTPTPMVSEKTSEIKGKLLALTKDLRGAYGIYVYNLTIKEGYGISEEEIFPAASLMKLPVILTLYQEAEAGRINLEEKYILKNSDKQPGAGGIQYKPAGTVYTLRRLAEAMGKQSDNTAFFVLRKILGDEKIQKTIDRLGMKKTSLAKFETTPQDVGLFFRKLYAGAVISRSHRDEILNYLTKTFDESRIPAGVPEGIRVSHKVGTEIGVVADAGIVFAKKPFVLVLMSKGVLESQAKEVLPKITREIWDFENR